MADTVKIRSFETVERIQEINESRFDKIASNIDQLSNNVNQVITALDRSRMNGDRAMEIALRNAKTTEQLISKVDSSTSRLDQVNNNLENAINAINAIERSIAKSDSSSARFDQATTNLENASRIVERFAAKPDSSIDMLEKERLEHSKKMEIEFQKYEKNFDRKFGHLGSTHGAFVEAIALPSIQRIVEDELNGKFHGTYKYSILQTNLEIDAWASRGRRPSKEIFLFRVKKKFRRADIRQFSRQIRLFRELNPEFAQSPLYPFLVVVFISEENEKYVWEQGIHLIRVGGDVFNLGTPPEGFEHKYNIGIRTRKNNFDRRTPPKFYLEQLTRSKPMTFQSRTNS